MQNNISYQTKKLAVLALFSAVSVMLVVLIHFPIFPSASFLEYDPANIPILICAFVFGPSAGLMVTVVVAVVQGLTVSANSGIYGIIMHILATSTFVATAALIYRRKKTMLYAGAGVIAGTIAMAAVMACANLLITPLFTGGSVNDVKRQLLPLIIPFNIIKAGINGIIAFALFKPVEIALKKLGF